MTNLFCIKDKVILITGGAGILGRTIAEYLAEQGSKIVILDRDENAGKALVEDIQKKGGEAAFFITDVLNQEVLEKKQRRYPG